MSNDQDNARFGGSVGSCRESNLYVEGLASLPVGPSRTLTEVNGPNEDITGTPPELGLIEAAGVGILQRGTQPTDTLYHSVP